jgi:hypothetical protein
VGYRIRESFLSWLDRGGRGTESQTVCAHEQKRADIRIGSSDRRSDTCVFNPGGQNRITGVREDGMLTKRINSEPGTGGHARSLNEERHG